jgi:Fe2+ transport system protein FeoA
MGDPVEIKVRGYNLTLRKHEAEQILVQPTPKA